MQNKISEILADADLMTNMDPVIIENMISKYPYASAYRLLKAAKCPEDAENIHNLTLMMPNRLYVNPGINKSGLMPDIRHTLSSESNTVKGDVMHHKTSEVDAMPNVVTKISSNPVVHTDILPDIMETQVTEDTIVISPIKLDNSEISDREDAAVDLFDNSLKSKKSDKKKQSKFKLKEYRGISQYALWLLSFKKDDLEKKIKKEEKLARKKAFEENARKSITKSSAIISEPLAEILASQGHLDDAKKMYEQLMLKYPEKSSYFAAKINHLIKI